MSKIESTAASPSQAMGARWHIADIQRETGLGKDTLRVWERRYGFPLPDRDARGERRYSAEQLQQLQLIKRLMDAGHRAGQVVGKSTTELQRLLNAPSIQTKKMLAQPSKAPSAAAFEEPWVDWLASNEIGLIKQALQRNIVRHGLAKVIETTIAPLCQLVGQAWLQGAISVYQEHLFTEALQSVLREAIAVIDGAAGGVKHSPRVMLTTTSNEQHGLGLLMAECQFALESCERYVLGTSTPLSEMIEAAARLNIDVLALSFSAHTARGDLVDSLRQLKAQLPTSVQIWVGGAGASAFARAIPQGICLLKSMDDIAAQLNKWRADQSGEPAIA